MSQLQPQQLQPQPQQLQPQQQQPVLVYPNTATRQPPNHHSNGSFGTVFIVLAVIIVISAIACFLGRLCSKKLNSQKPKQSGHNFRPKERDINFHPKEGDIEFGFDKRIPNGKPVGNGGIKGFKPYENGHMGSGMKPADDGESRAGA